MIRIYPPYLVLPSLCNSWRILIIFFYIHIYIYGNPPPLLSYPGTWFSPYRTLSFSYKSLTKWVGKHERKSPVMGTTSSSHNSADSIDVPQDQKETPARNRASTSLKSIVYLFFYSSLFPLCMVFLTLKYLAHKSHNCSNYRLLCVSCIFLNR